MQGFLNLNKSAGLTSHDCVARVRRLLRIKRIGHGGTLDPAATGVLPVAVGKATRLLQFLPPDKAYKATIQLGITTTTDDLAGEVITSHPAHLSLEQVTAALTHFEGKIHQIPPSYSAIQISGKRMYDLARKGEKVEIPARSVEVFKIDVLEWKPGDFPQVDVEISCGAGTYIRAIARDLGTILQTGGTLAALCRTHSSGFSLVDSLTLEQVETQLQQGTLQLIPPAVALQLPRVTLPPTTAQKWCQGQRIPWDNADSLELNSPLQVYHQSNYFLGIGQLINADELQLIPQIVF